jgi:hypothetical protein
MIVFDISKEAFEREAVRRSLAGLAPWSSPIIQRLNSAGIPLEKFEQNEEDALFNFCVNLPAMAIMLIETKIPAEAARVEHFWVRDSLITSLLIKLALHPLRLDYNESQPFQQCLDAFTTRGSRAPNWTMSPLLSVYAFLRQVVISIALHAWADEEPKITSGDFDALEEWLNQQELGSFINTNPLRSAVAVLLHEFAMLSRLSKVPGSRIAPFPAPSGPNPSHDEAMICVQAFLGQAGAIRESPLLLHKGTLEPGGFAEAISVLGHGIRPVLIESIYTIDGQKQFVFCLDQEGTMNMQLANEVKKAYPEVQLSAVSFPLI